MRQELQRLADVDRRAREGQSPSVLERLARAVTARELAFDSTGAAAAPAAAAAQSLCSIGGSALAGWHSRAGISFRLAPPLPGVARFEAVPRRLDESESESLESRSRSLLLEATPGALRCALRSPCRCTTLLSASPRRGRARRCGRRGGARGRSHRDSKPSRADAGGSGSEASGAFERGVSHRAAASRIAAARRGGQRGWRRFATWTLLS